MNTFILIITFIFINLTIYCQVWKNFDSPKSFSRVDNIEFENEELYFINFPDLYKISKDSIIDISTLEIQEKIRFSDIFVKDEYIFISSNYNISKKGGLFRSSDNGNNWINVLNTEKISITNINYFDNKIYIKVGKTLLNSNDYGESWDSVFSDLSIQGNNLLVKIGNKILMFDEGGRTQNGIVNKGFVIYDVENSNISNGIIENNILVEEVEVYNDTIYACTSSGLFYSIDYGVNWEKISINNNFHSINNIEMDDDIIYVSTETGYVFKYYKSNQNWDLIKDNSSFGIIHDLKLIDSILYIASNNGVELITNNKSEFISKKSNSTIYDLGVIENQLSLTTFNEGIIKYNETEWSVLNDSLNPSKNIYLKFHSNENSIIAFNPSFHKQNSITISNDKGENWIERFVGADNTIVKNVYSYGNILYVINYSGELYFSTDNGIKWNLKNDKFYNYIESWNSDLYLSSKEGVFKSDILLDNQIKINIEDINFDYISIYKNNLILSNGNNVFHVNLELNLNVNIIPTNVSNITKTIVYKDNIFILTDENVIFSSDLGNSWTMLNFGLEGIVADQFSEYVDFEIYKDNLYLATLTHGIYYLPLSELGINYTSVEESNIECTNLIETEYYDLLGNQLEENNIYNKQVIVRYKCLETGEFTHKLEIRER